MHESLVQKNATALNHMKNAAVLVRQLLLAGLKGRVSPGPKRALLLRSLLNISFHMCPLIVALT